jgi:anaerobic selenocysteine-containing dehydrogenase
VEAAVYDQARFTGAREAQPLRVEVAEGEEVTLKKTYCKVCMTNCGMVAEVVDDRKILKVTADREHPITKGYSCPKGRAMGQGYHLDQPITEPLMRKNGKLEVVSWEEAVADIGKRLRKVVDRYGPHSVGMYFGSGLGLDSAGYVMEEALWRALDEGPKFTPLTNDTTAKVMIAGAMARFYGVNPKTDYDNCKMVMYVGTNPMVSHAHNTGMFQPGMWFKAINKRGGEIWVIDPVRTETVNYAKGHLAAYPGKDYAILAWIAREILADGSFAPAQAVRNRETLEALLADYTLEFASEVSGVPAEQIEALLAAIRRQRIVCIETGTGVGMSPGCNLTNWFAWLIMILTGSMNVKGGLWIPPGVIFPFDRFVEHLPLLDSPFTRSSHVRPDVKGICGDWPCAVLPQEIEQGYMHAFFNFGGHLFRAFPDANALREALPKLDLLVATEIQHNEFSDYCTHILPTKATLERNEFTRWDTLNWSVNIQYAPRLVKPMGNRRSAWWAIAEIMRAADLPTPNHVPREHSEANDDLMQAKIFENARCSWEELKEKRVLEYPLELPAPWFERLIERAGGWELAPAELVAQWRQFRAQDEADRGKPRPLVYSSRRQRRKFNGQLSFLGEICDALIHPETAALHGIADGQQVRVSNKAGEIVVTAKISPGMARDVVSIPHGHGEANVNNLTSTFDMDPLGGMAHYSAVPIEIAPLVEA